MLGDIKNKECRFAVHFPTLPNVDYDLHLIKEQIHNEDGTITPSVKFIKDYERSFYVEKKSFQNHEQKKEWAPINHLNRFSCTQSKLKDTVAKALGKSWSRDNLRKLSDSPFLYGSDISSTTLIKHEYTLANPDLKTPYTIADFDIEYDVVSGVNQIIIITVAFGSYIWTGILLDFVKGINNVEYRIENAMNEYLSEYTEKRKLKCVTFIADNEETLIREAFKEAHALKPDLLAIWNMNYDIPKVLESLAKFNVDPKDVFSDPSVPEQLRYFNYIQGGSKHTSISGVVKPKPPSAQWHTVECPSSFYVIDAMCVYRQVRTGTAEKQSYALDAILKEEKMGISKLKFTATDQYQHLKWHQVMQSDYKIEYIIYNRFDCIAMQLLEERVNDLSVAMPMFAGDSDFSIFNSQPKMLADKLYFNMLDVEGYVAGTVGSRLEQPADAETTSLSGWIGILPAHSILDNGLTVVKELPKYKTSVRKFVFD